MQPSKKPLIVVLGLGEMGMVHATNLSKHRSIRLGLASTRPSALRSAAHLHADKEYTSYATALSDPDASAIVIATTVTSHPQMVSLSARMGKHIFCEKPIGNIMDLVYACLGDVSDQGVRFMTGFQRRWDESFAAAKAKVEKGDLGKPVLLKCTSGDPEYPEKYHRLSEKNSMLLDLAVHDIDQARWLMGSEVVKVYTVIDALTYPGLKRNGDSDIGIVVLEMQNGGKAVLHLSRALSYGYNVNAEYVGTKGSLRIGDLRRDDVVELSDGGKREAIQWDFRERFKSAFENEMAAFVKLVCADEKDVSKLLEDSRYAGPQDGLNSAIVAQALVKSAESGLPVDVVYK